MPSTTIETKYDFGPDHAAEIMNAVFDAQAEALGVPEDYRNVRYFEHEPQRFFGPPSKDDRHVHIEISLFTGRSNEVKRELFNKTVEKLSELGHPANEISIVLHEQPAENWYYGA